MAIVDITPKEYVDPASKATTEAFLLAAESITIWEPKERASEVEYLRQKHQRSIGAGSSYSALQSKALINIFADLIQQGWQIDWRSGTYLGTTNAAPDPQKDREHKRHRFNVRRDEQLRGESTRKFIMGMERENRFNGEVISIFSLMRDGRDLGEKLTSVDLSSIEGWRQCIDPYLDFVGGGTVCPHTGYKLQDIWRYFRHSWSNPYESIPGRTLQYIIRDKAAKYHPIIGIGALSSASIGLGKRDEYIGWTEQSVIEMCRNSKPAKLKKWISETLDRLVQEIYRADFVNESLLPAALPDIVSYKIIELLKVEAEKAKNTHFSALNRSENKQPNLDGTASDEEWLIQSKTPLFRGKRAAELANLFTLKNQFSDLLDGVQNRDVVTKILESTSGRKILSKVVKAAKASTVGTEIADLTVCGAIPPYNEILGGKLSAALSVCPSVIHEYKRRYGGVASIIASSMAGRRIERENNLVFVATTSLYGVRPNQYDRINIPCEIVGGEVGQQIRFKYLGSSEDGVGTFQFGKATKSSVEQFAMASKNGVWRANNVFGEGVSPKLRSLRDGLTALGLPHEDLLKHGMTKSIYAISLIHNLAEYLLGMDKKPKYVFDIKNPGWVEDALVNWWFSRWGIKRVTDQSAIDRILGNTLIRPIRHGARVELPENDIEQLTMPIE